MYVCAFVLYVYGYGYTFVYQYSRYCTYVHTYERTQMVYCFLIIFLPLVPVSRSVTFGEVTRGLINDSTTYSDSAHYRAPFGEVEDSGTSHVSVLDPSGLAVSVTR